MTADYSHMMTAAQASTASRDWGEAAQTFAAAAQLALNEGRAQPAWRAWLSAGECWRRDDRPTEAELCLRRALELTEPSGTAAAATAPKLAAVLADLGLAELADDLLESISTEQLPGSMPAAFLDTRIGILISLGRKEAARIQLQALSSTGPSGLLAADYRRTLLYLLDGDLARARQCSRKQLSALQRDGDPAAVASGLMVLAQCELYLGAEREALARYQAAANAWREAGREALAWHAEAGAVRATLALGVHPLPGLLDAGITFAKERDLVVLGIRLRIARGIALAEHAPGRAYLDLQQAMEDAMAAGLPLLVGQAAYERAVRLEPSETEQQHLLDTASMALVSHVPLAARVALARARLLARFDPAQARSVARACVPLLERMGMSRDLVAAKVLVRHLG
ncbi:MAG: hypothetical protein EA397_03185 [Deltaproteobacteria bacterium]|nr:MAG: hypothetical protein EA397_03185 [Deltaproteobacteria bacterium]